MFLDGILTLQHEVNQLNFRFCEEGNYGNEFNMLILIPGEGEFGVRAAVWVGSSKARDAQTRRRLQVSFIPEL